MKNSWRMLRIFGLMIALVAVLARPSEAILNSREIVPELPPGLTPVNGDPGNLASLRGRVVLLYFWNSTSHESLNHLAYLNELYITYKDQGLSVLAVHIPDREFEKDPAVLTRLLNRYRLYVPVLQDSQAEALRAYFATEVPWLIIIDREGRMRGTLMPPISQRMLFSRVNDLIAESRGTPLDPWPEEALQPLNGPFPILKFNFGYRDLAFFGNSERVRSEEVQEFVFPEFLQPNLFYIEGTWRFQPELAEILSEKARVRFYFQGAVLSVVAEAPSNVTRDIRIRMDQKPLEKMLRGRDILQSGEETFLKVSEPRCYMAVSLPAPLREGHEVELMISGEMTYLYKILSSDMPTQLSEIEPEEVEEETEELRLTTTLEAA